MRQRARAARARSGRSGRRAASDRSSGRQRVCEVQDPGRRPLPRPPARPSVSPRTNRRPFRDVDTSEERVGEERRPPACSTTTCSVPETVPAKRYRLVFVAPAPAIPRGRRSPRPCICWDAKSVGADDCAGNGRRPAGVGPAGAAGKAAVVRVTSVAPASRACEFLQNPTSEVVTSASPRNESVGGEAGRECARTVPVCADGWEAAAGFLSDYVGSARRRAAGGSPWCESPTDTALGDTEHLADLGQRERLVVHSVSTSRSRSGMRLIKSASRCFISSTSNASTGL